MEKDGLLARPGVFSGQPYFIDLAIANREIDRLGSLANYSLWTTSVSGETISVVYVYDMLCVQCACWGVTMFCRQCT